MPVETAGLALRLMPGLLVPEPGDEKGADAALAQPPVASAISATISAASR